MDTRTKILEFIKVNSKVRSEDIRREFHLNRSIIHRHLLKLLLENKVSKSGKPPLVFYMPNENVATKNKIIDVNIYEFLQKNYLYISPSGQMLYGREGFLNWVINTNQQKHLEKLITEYTKLKKATSKHFNKIGLIEAKTKIKNTFPKNYLNNVYFADFYSIDDAESHSLPKFGKTTLGQKVLHSKQAQLEDIINEIANEIKNKVLRLISKEKIEAVAFIPPTIPRKIQFLKEIERNLNLKLPTIKLVKSYSGQVPIAQKTLSKLEERIKNAQQSIFIKDINVNYERILIIDDAIGSGATLNEVTLKIKQINPKAKVFGFAIVGSFKGFDVISEV